VASQLKKTLVLHDEGISREFLLQEGVDRADAFVAVTADDRTNLLAAMNARQLGAGLIVAGISQAEFAPLSDALGVDIAISPRLLAAGAVLRFVRRGEVVAVTLLESGAQMIELRVPPGCRAANRPLANVDFPEGAIVRGDLQKRRGHDSDRQGRPQARGQGRRVQRRYRRGQGREAFCTLGWSQTRWAS
jgi:trk system potassium uptake protein TrkA